MARKCQSKNPSQCHIHGMGGMEEKLNLSLIKALDINDVSEAVRLRSEIDNLSDNVESVEKEKASFFGRFKSYFNKANASETSTPVSNAIENETPYTGLMMDCGTCISCDPPPSNMTHFRHLSSGTCDRPIPMPISEVASKVLSRNLDFTSGRTTEQLVELHGKVSSVLEDSSKSEFENGASKAAVEVRDLLWDDFSNRNGDKDTSRGGFVSAASASDIFHALGREKELGWIEQDAPGYGHRIARNLQTESLLSSMQQLLSESPSSFARKHTRKQQD